MYAYQRDIIDESFRREMRELMEPNHIDENKMESVYQERILELIKQGHTTRSAKRKIEKAKKQNKPWW